MSRVHWDIGDSKIACQFLPPPASYRRSTVIADVTCMCCQFYTDGTPRVFCETTIRKHARLASYKP